MFFAIVMLFFIVLDIFMIYDFRKFANVHHNSKFFRNKSYVDIVNQLRSMEAFEFEDWTSQLFCQLGYNARVSEKSGAIHHDGGKDVIAINSSGDITYVECKRWSESEEFDEYKVGREICQKLIGAMVGDGVTHGIVVTTGTIHENAYEYQCNLEKNNPNIQLEIWNIDKLAKVYLDLLDTKEPLIENKECEVHVS